MASQGKASEESALPPMPDPVTGQPRPPNAPIYGRVPDEADASGGKAPSPPRGCGPTLEWHVESGSKPVKSAIFGAAVMIAVFFVGAGADWVRYWWVWLIVVGVSLILYFGLRGTFYAAGADWLRTKHGWVNTYDLVRIKLEVTTRAQLTLQDSTKRGVSVDIAGIQLNRRLWNLVYNGMLHSIANGTATEVSRYAQGALKLPKAVQR